MVDSVNDQGLPITPTLKPQRNTGNVSRAYGFWRDMGEVDQQLAWEQEPVNDPEPVQRDLFK